MVNSRVFQVDAAVSDEANIRKLVAGHLDAFVLDEKTGVKAFEQMGLDNQMQYDPSQPISRQEVYYAFQNTAAGRLLAERFTSALVQLKREGRYQKITRGVTFVNGCSR